MFRLKSLNKFQNFTTQRAFSNIQLENTFDRSNRIPLLSTLLLSTIGFLTVTTAVYTFVNTKYIFAESLHESMIVDQTDDKSLITQMTLDFDSIKASKDNINIYMYGSNSGRLIDPQSTETYIRNPRPIDFFKGKILRDLVLTEEYAVAVDKNGDVFEWGVGFNDTNLEPNLILKDRNIKQVVCTDSNIYLLSKNGILYSIKSSGVEQKAQMKKRMEKLNHSLFNLKNYIQSTEEQCLDKMYFGSNITKIVGGKSHLIALTNNGQLKGLSTGDNGNLYGQLGQGNNNALTKEFVSIPASSKVTDVVCGSNHTIFTTEDNKIHGFGSNTYGQLATGSIGEIPAVLLSPTEIQTIWTRFTKSPPPTGSTCVKIAAGGDTSYFVIQGQASNEVVSCGYGVNAQLGNGSYFHMQPHPAKIGRLSGLSEWCDVTKSVQQIGVHDLQSSTTHSVAVLSNSRTTEFGRDVLVWGLNTKGQLNRFDQKKMVAATPVLAAGLRYDNSEKTITRLSLTPEFRVDGMKVEQKIVCGPGITAVYMKVI